MPAIAEECTITSKGQTTVPKAIRKALGVDYGGKIAYRLEEGRVVVEAVATETADPALDSFLNFLTVDIQEHPERLQALTPELARKIAELTRNISVDPDEAIDGEVSL